MLFLCFGNLNFSTFVCLTNIIPRNGSGINRKALNKREMFYEIRFTSLSGEIAGIFHYPIII